MAWISSRVQSFLNGPLAWIAAADKAGPAVVEAAAAAVEDVDCTDASRVGVAVLYRRLTERNGCVARRTADMAFFFDADVREGKEKRRGWVLGISLKPKKLLAVHQTPRPCSGVPRSLLPVRKTNVESYANVTYTRRLHAMFPLLTFTATSQRPRAFWLVWIGTENFSWLDIATSNHARSSGRTVISADVQRSSFNRIRRLSNAQSFAKLLDRYYLLLMLSTTLSRIFSGDSMPRTVQMINLSEMAGLLVRIKIILIRVH